MNLQIMHAVIIAWMRGYNSAEIARLVNQSEPQVLEVLEHWRSHHAEYDQLCRIYGGP